MNMDPMRRAGLPLLLACSFVLGITLGSTTAGAQSRPQYAGPGFSSVKSKLQRSGSARVLVRLDVGYRPESTLSRPAASSQRSSIQRAQSGVLSDLPERAYDVRHEFKSIPWMSLNVSSDAFDALTKSPRIQEIREVTSSSPLLDDSVPLLEGDTVHASGDRGTDSTVVVLDTGLDLDHPAFEGRIVDQACFSDGDCPDGSDKQLTGDAAVPLEVDGDPSAHGTYVSGVATGAFVESNDLLVSSDLSPGVAPRADVIPIMVFYESTDDTDCGAVSAPCALSWKDDQAAALEYVRDTLADRFDIASVNMSLGGSALHDSACSDDLLQPLIQDLRNQGIPVVAATGNDGSDNEVTSPACVEDAVGVGATEGGDPEELSSLSNRNTELTDFVAPGVSIYSAFPDRSAGYRDGTSLSAPHVAGTLALLGARDGVGDIETLLTTLKASGNVVNDGADTYPSPRVGQACDQLLGTGPLDSNCYPGRVTITNPADESATGTRPQIVRGELTDANTGDALELFKNGERVKTSTVSDTFWEPSVRLGADTTQLSMEMVRNEVKTGTDGVSVLLDQVISLDIVEPADNSIVENTPFTAEGTAEGLDGDTLVVTFSGDSSDPLIVPGETLFNWQWDFTFEGTGNETIVARLFDRGDRSNLLVEEQISIQTEEPPTGFVKLTQDFKRLKDNNRVKTFASEQNFGVFFIGGSPGWSSYSSDPAMDPDRGEFLAVDHPDMRSARLNVLTTDGRRVYRKEVLGTSRIRWDGTNESGGTVSNGPYVVRVQVTLDTSDGTVRSEKTFPVMVLK